MKKIILFVVLVSFTFVNKGQTNNSKDEKFLSTESVSNNLLSLSILDHPLSTHQTVTSDSQHVSSQFPVKLAVKPRTQVLDMGVQMLSADVQKKSPGLAILYSLLLPGMGELYANGYDSGKYFTIADGILWGTFAGFTYYGNWKRTNYESFAETNAEASMANKDEDFKANVGIYMSMDEYNREMDLERSFEKVYTSKSYYWNWKSNDERKEYRDLWSSSEAAFNKVRFVVGALILNRVISAINAVRLVSAYNKSLSQELSWNIYFGVEERPTLPQSFTFNFVTRL